MKKRGFGAGRWNGFGGKVQEGEELEATAIRETQEEAGILPLELVKCGVLEFEYPDSLVLLEVHVFKATSWEGEPQETEEMRPKWFDLNHIPYDEMWADDRHWLPLLLAEKEFKGWFKFNDKDEVLSHKLEVK